MCGNFKGHKRQPKESILIIREERLCPKNGLTSSKNGLIFIVISFLGIMVSIPNFIMIYRTISGFYTSS